MSWKYTFANWQVEVDWEGLTLTPLVPNVTERRDQAKTEDESPRRFSCAPTFDAPHAAGEGEQQVWV